MDAVKIRLTASQGILGALLFTLGACASTHPMVISTPPLEATEATVRLAEAATSISQSLNNLKALERAASGPLNGKRLAYPSSYALPDVVSVDWSGPIQPLLQRIADMKRWKLRVIGRRPALPVLVTIDARNTPLNYVVQDLDLQAGTQAAVRAYPALRTILLKYGHP